MTSKVISRNLKSMSKKENPFKIVLEYDMSNSFKIKKYKKWFKNRLDNSQPIPSLAIKRFMALFKTEEELQKVQTELINSIIKNSLNRFNKYNYNFSYVPPQQKTRNILDYVDYGKPYSLEAMLHYVLNRMVDLDGEEIYKTQNEFIYYAYESMNNYQKEYRVPEKNLRKYKKEVLSAYLSYQVRFGETQTKNKTTIQLRDISKNAISSVTKKKKLR